MKFIIFRVAVVTLAGCLLAGALAACGSSTGAQPPPGPHAVVHVSIGPVSNTSGAVYSPNPVRVRLGQTITWTNNDRRKIHSATADDYLFDSGPIAVGASWSWRPTQAGTYPYFCTYHRNMRGTIIVIR